MGLYNGEEGAKLSSLLSSGRCQDKATKWRVDCVWICQSIRVTRKPGAVCLTLYFPRHAEKERDIPSGGIPIPVRSVADCLSVLLWFTRERVFLVSCYSACEGVCKSSPESEGKGVFVFISVERGCRGVP